MSEDTAVSSSFKWRTPQEAMQMHQLKRKKKALQARINFTSQRTISNNSTNSLDLETVVATAKRKNPFINNSIAKKTKPEIPSNDAEESTDQTLFKLLHMSTSTSSKGKENLDFSNFLDKTEEVKEEVVKVAGEKWLPIDWTLKTKCRFMSLKPFSWNQKLKVSEEASGITSFARCLDTTCTDTSLDTSPNAKFHQCCLYWQHPSIPWLKLFPRTTGKVSATGVNLINTHAIKESLQTAWSDSLRSLFQLLRTRQCPYFYLCADNFSALFRAAGICGFSETHAIITPTTRGFRNLLKQEDIEFTMPLKIKRHSDADSQSQDVNSEIGNEHVADEDEPPDEKWFESMGINAEDIKQINYTQEKVQQKMECLVDNSEQSLILIEGHEVQALYNFLINCKSTVAQTGPLAGVPPTLLAPVAFHGSTLSALKVRESKVRVDNAEYYSIELLGPILPHTIHNLCAIHSPDHSMTATFANLPNTLPFSKILCKNDETSKKGSDEMSSGTAVFSQVNLSDCGLQKNVLHYFCSDNPKHVSHFECLKYTCEDKTYSWT